ncbi:[acyl-carrier-protein] S-malonyltransferase [Rhodoblastus acidophilus]|uniref:ACP S-malonyltransferase n=1 Tax=Rhodoblastus acidophilus TaxID=1074 RepID=UPI002224447E|nr:acyltransferase domain-containing protein [Rhodoblastus acidophilus]MCW2286660.1 [acyl-carrier-protein] S-malonyltransferase [Rhodoblastus acidophilus]MCW2335480.1 [acyl-carrier-protein] S-malonyltransferase [Rhodoblastus acidophilus]
MFDILDGAEAIWQAFAQTTGLNAFSLSAGDMQVNAVAQPLVCAYQLAVWSHLAEKLPEPLALAGYSVGELAAYGCAGALAPEDVVALARRRAEAMDAAHSGGGAMVALRGLSRDTVGKLCAQTGAEIAIINAADRIVCGGAPGEVADFSNRAEVLGGKPTPLAIRIPSHTSLMRPAVAPFLKALEQARWRTPAAPVLEGLTGAPAFTPAQARNALSAQLAQTIDWAACLDGLRERGCTVLLELGPGSGLARMARDRFPDLPARSVAEFKRLDGAALWAASALNA